jgi:hypothetical protein
MPIWPGNKHINDSIPIERMSSPNSQPNCFKCQFFYITYEPSHPYGCRAMSFKSKEIPSTVTYVSSGMVCQMFKLKEKKRGEK